MLPKKSHTIGALIAVAALCASPAKMAAQEANPQEAYLGVITGDLQEHEAKALGWSAPRGVRVTQIINPIPSEKGNLKVGDIILTAAGIETRGWFPNEFKSGIPEYPRLNVLLELKRPGEKIELVVFRDGQERMITATLVARIRGPQPPLPACKGRDLLAELERTDPAGHATIIAATNATPNSKGLLWRIEKAGLAPSYLFGTMHITDDRVNNLSQKVKEAFATANRLAFEIELSTTAEAMRRIGTLGKYGDGRSLKTELPPADYSAFRDLLKKRGLAEGRFDDTRPWLIMLQFPILSCERLRQTRGLKVLDVRLYEDAKARGVPVVGLESDEERMKLKAATSTFTQLAELVALTRSQEHEEEDQLETLVGSYLRREIGVAKHFFGYLREKDEKAGKASVPASARDEIATLHVRRNHNMLKAAMPLLEQGGLFISVGAFHLPGHEGLVELFRQSGYQLSLVD